MMKKIAVRSVLSCFVFLATLCMGQTWKPGDVFVAVGNGYQVWRYSSTTQTYTQVGSVAVTPPTGGTSGLAGGCAFDSQFNFYATQSYTDANGNLAGQVVEFSNGTAISRSAPAGADSIVFDASGDFYVGSSNASVVQYRPLPPPDGQDAGANSIPISYTYDITKPIPFNVKVGAAQQVDLATDQTNIFFTSANPNVKNNPSTLTQIDLTNPTSSTVTPLGGTAWAVRLLAPANLTPGTTPPSPINGLLVADDSSVLKLNGSGATSFSQHGGKHSFRFLALDWDGQSVWVGDYGTGNVYKVNIASMAASTSFATGSSNTSPMGGVCTYGGQQLNIVPLQFNTTGTVTQTAAFGDPQIDPLTKQPSAKISPPQPDSANYHTWSATAQFVPPYTLLVSAIQQGPAVPASSIAGATSPIALLDRFDEYFCNQAEPLSNNPPPNNSPFPPSSPCLISFSTPPGPSLVPIPYTDQMVGANNVPTVSGTGTIDGSLSSAMVQANSGNRMVYRVQNPPPICSATVTSGCTTTDIAVTIHFAQPPVCQGLLTNGNTVVGPTGLSFSTAANCYVPPQCVTNGYVSNPRLMRDPSQSPFDGDHEFALDTTSNFLLDTGVTSGGGRNDHMVVDRCPNIGGGVTGFAQASFNSPVPKGIVSLGSTVPVKVNVTDANGNPVNSCVINGNAMTVDVTDKFGNLEFATPRSFDFFTQNGGAGGTYSGNLNTSGLATGQTTLCVTSTTTSTNPSSGSGQFPPICTTFFIQ